MASLVDQHPVQSKNVEANAVSTSSRPEQHESKIVVAEDDQQPEFISRAAKNVGQPDFELPATDDGPNFRVVSYENVMGMKTVYQSQPSENRYAIDRDGRQLSTTRSDLDVEATRVHHIWPGKNVFFFGGRFICGPDPRGFIITMISILLSNWVFCIYVGGDSSKHGALVIAFSVILTVIVLLNLVMVSARDPGIIPRNDDPPLLEEDGTAATATANADTDWDLRVGSKSMRANGVEMMKFCRICMIFRPPRSCHCAICDNCVDKFDHHCPWIGQCVGLRNYRFYILFIVSALVFYVYIFAFSCRKIDRRMTKTGTGILVTVSRIPETLALVLFSFIAVLFLGCLTTLHAYLIVLNQTGYENYRRRFISKPNPYDRGITANIKEALFEQLPPGRVNFRAVVDPSWYSGTRIPEEIGGSGFLYGEEEKEKQIVDILDDAEGSPSPSPRSRDREHFEEVYLEK